MFHRNWVVRAFMITWLSAGSLAITGCGNSPPPQARSIELQEQALEQLNKGKPGKARKLLDESIQLTPDSAEAYRLQSMAWMQLSQWDKAIVDAKQAIVLDPNSANLRNNLAAHYIGKGDIDAAVTPAEEAIKLDPNFPKPYCNLAEVYRLKKNFDLAIQNSSKAIELEPNSARGYYYRAAAYVDSGQPREALADLDIVLEHQPKDALTHQWRAQAYFAIGEHELAEKSASHARKLNPNIEALPYIRRGSVPAIGLVVREVAERFPNSVELTIPASNRPIPLPAHRGAICDVAFSPDGKMLASAGQDGTVKLWDPQTQNVVGELAEEDAHVTDLAFSRDGQTLATSHVPSGEGFRLRHGCGISIWDLKTKTIRKTLAGRQPYCRTLDFIDNNTIVVSYFNKAKTGAVNQEVVWQRTDKDDGWISVQPGRVTGAHFVVKSRQPHVAILTDTNNLRTNPKNVSQALEIWDLAQSKLLAVFPVLKQVQSLAISPDDRYLAISYPQDLEVIDLTTSQSWLEEKIAAGTWDGLAFTGDSKTVAVACLGGAVRLFDVTNGLLAVNDLLRFGPPARSIAFAPDQLLMASAWDDDVLNLWSLNPSPPLLLPAEELTDYWHGGKVTALAVSHDNQTLAVGGTDRKVHLVNLEKGTVTEELGPYGSEIVELKYSRNGKWIAIATGGHWDFSQRGDVLVHDIDTGKDRLLRREQGRVVGLAFSPNEKYLLSTDRAIKLNINVWEAETGEQIHSIQADHELGLARFYGNGEGVAVASHRHIRLLDWDASKPNEFADQWQKDQGVAIFATGEDRFYTLSYLDVSPDGKTIAFASINESISLLVDAQSLQLKGSIRGEVPLFSPDGKWVATRVGEAARRPILLSDPATGEERCLAVSSGNSMIESVAFGQDGRVLYAGNGSGRLTVWHLPVKLAVAHDQ